MSIIEKPLLFILLILVCIIVALYVTQKCASKYPDRTFLYRKLLHIVSVGLCSFAIQCLGPSNFLIGLFILASIVLTFEVKNKFFRISAGDSYGIALFPLAFALLLIGGVDFRIVAISGYVLTFSDAIAGLLGRSYGKYKITPFKEEKTTLGSLSFFIITGIILFSLNWLNLPFGAILIVSLIATVAEMFSWKGSDNFTIIMSTSLAIILFNYL